MSNKYLLVYRLISKVGKLVVITAERVKSTRLTSKKIICNRDTQLMIRGTQRFLGHFKYINFLKVYKDLVNDF